MNKRGATFGNWTDTILFGIILIIALGTLGFSLNNLYGTNVDLSFGLDKYTNYSGFINYQESYETATSNSQSTFTQNTGLTLSGLWGIIQSISGLVSSFLTGGFIESIVALMQLPMFVGHILRILWIMGIGFIVIKLVTRVNP